MYRHDKKKYAVPLTILPLQFCRVVIRKVNWAYKTWIGNVSLMVFAACSQCTTRSSQYQISVSVNIRNAAAPEPDLR